MQDLTKASITGRLLKMGLFIAIAMVVRTAYLFVDLSFVSRFASIVAS